MPKKRKRVRKNPSNPSRGRAITSRSTGALRGLNFREALNHLWMYQLGMFASKWAAKRGSEQFPATQTDPESWGYMSYIKGSLGSTLAAMLANMIKPGSGQKVLEGGINLMAYQLIQNELVTKSEFATGQLGQATGPQIVTDEDGTPALMQPDGTFLPLDESHRAQDMGDYGEELTPVTHLGDALVRPSHLGTDDAYYAAFRQR